MISPTPTSLAPDWPSFGHAQSHDSLHPSQRPWGPTGLGGEALQHNNTRRATNLTDPIGSRPGSRLDERGTSPGPSSSPISAQDGKTGSSFFQSNGQATWPRASAAAAVAAAANSAAARSRAASPVNAAAPFDSTGNGFMSFASSGYLAGAGPKSPSFGLSSEGAWPTLSASGQHPAETPKLVVDNVERPTARVGSEERQATIDAWSTGLDSTGPRSPSTDHMTASFSSLMSKPNESFPFGPAGSDTTPPKPSRANTDSSLLSNSATWAPPGRGFPAPYQPSVSTSGSTSSLAPLQSSGLLSPAGAGSNSNPLSPAGTTPGGSSLSASQGSLPGQPLTSPPGMLFGQPQGMPMPAAGGHGIPDNNAHAGFMGAEVDAHLRASPLFVDVVERLGRHENSVRELNHTILSLNRNVSLLLERTKHMPPQHLGHPMRGMPAPFNGAPAAGMSDEARAMSAQLNHIGGIVTQLMAKTGLQVPGASASHALHQPHAGLGGVDGLGLAPQQRQPSSGSNMPTPQLGASNAGFPPSQMNQFGGMNAFAAPNPRLGAMNGVEGAPRQPQGMSNDRGSRLSPRSGLHSPNPSSRRWRDAANATTVETSTPSGAMQPPDPSVIVTKWEHLNLHPDLLRSILRYGLGPPNKIQQRALPFLLRGSDIIAQAPPTQERIASYVIPVLQLVLNVMRGEGPLPSHMGVRGPMALIISTTVDQATQAQRMAMGLGAQLGIRVHIAATAGVDLAQDATAIIQTQPQIVVGTPQRMMDLFSYLANKTKGAVSLDDVRAVILDEVDQLIARNLADHVSTLLRLLSSPRIVQSTAMSAPKNGARSPGMSASSSSSSLPVPGALSGSDSSLGGVNVSTTDRQTAIFSNTVPQDVLNFAQSIHLRESVRVLVRREGGNATVQPAFGGGNGVQGTATSASGSAWPDKAALQAQPVNALGASPAGHHTDPLSDPVLSPLRGLRQYYLYVAVTMGAGSHSSSASQAAHAVEMKLDVITDVLEDMEFGQAVVYTSSASSQEAVTYKLASKGVEALSLSRDMPSTTRQQVLAKYRQAGTPGPKKALVVHDIVLHPKDVQSVPLLVFYDLPRSVEEYKDRIACASAGGGASNRPSVCVNVVTGSGGPRGDIEMLRTLECHLGCKMAELPMNPGQILQF